MPLSASQTEGGGGIGSGGSGSFCTNSMGKLNFLISIDKKMHIFINSFTYCLKFGTKMKYLIWFVSLKHLDLNINLLPCKHFPLICSFLYGRVQNMSKVLGN